MITIRTQTFNARDIEMLIDALTTVREKWTKKENSPQLLVSLDYTIQFLQLEHIEKVNKETNRS